VGEALRRLGRTLTEAGKRSDGLPSGSTGVHVIENLLEHAPATGSTY